MTFGRWKAVTQELRAQREAAEREWNEQRARNEREWALVRREHQLTRRQLERSEQELEREFELNRRCYEAGMAFCAKLAENFGAVADASVSAMAEMRREIREHREEGRAQTQALLRVIDRMDRLDGGTAAA